MYDAKDRLVICNRRYRDLFQGGGEGAAVEGMTQRELLDAACDCNRRSDCLENFLDKRNEQIQCGGRWLLSSDHPTSEGGTVSLRYDITQLKRMEEELRAAKETAESATQAKSEFLANMSHEIRTPMNAIIGLSELALRTGLTSKQYDYVHKIDLSANNLMGIINEILDFSKIEAGKLEIECIDFQLQEILDNLAHVIGIRSGEKELELLIDLSSDVPQKLVGDPLRLGQVLINLANNAVKFTEAGHIAIGIELLERRDAQVRLRFAVSDTGIGMTLAQQKGLFRAFSQADGSTTRKYGGTGLGLIISKRLVEMMGGEIGVHSVAGEGSTFHFTVPLTVSSNTDASERREDDKQLHGRRLLIVDDNPVSREILARHADHFGMEIAEASSGHEALVDIAHADQQGAPFHLVLMDWKMPGLDGIETSRRIRSNAALGMQPKIIR
ncbi:MAG: hypothetical protein C3L25_07770 [Candidatus Sedimenticola endophacoides]|nr:MAG: hypothetical protein C3L26_07795 [Candidatus Sedimenticola endophacoides]PUE03318.1 MAG: hypothetical protein C3L25_07770 [Candidatus Sedimenticola endophacoides]